MPQNCNCCLLILSAIIGLGIGYVVMPHIGTFLLIAAGCGLLYAVFRLLVVPTFRALDKMSDRIASQLRANERRKRLGF